jgi:hypothetical protein
MKHIFLIYALISLIIWLFTECMSYTAGRLCLCALAQYSNSNQFMVLNFCWRWHQFFDACGMVFPQSLYSPRKRKLEQVLSFSTLHPFEQLGVLWLLDGEDEQEQVIQTIFDQSGLLKPIVQSDYYSNNCIIQKH